MTLLEIKSQLEASGIPIIKVIHKGENFKVLGLGFGRGILLKEHKSPLPAKLTVLEGSVRYKDLDTDKVLEKYHEQTIPVNMIHSVEGVEASLCLLTQG